MKKFSLVIFLFVLTISSMASINFSDDGKVCTIENLIDVDYDSSYDFSTVKTLIIKGTINGNNWNNHIKNKFTSIEALNLTDLNAETLSQISNDLSGTLKMEKLYLPRTATEIPYSLCSNNTSLKYVFIPNTVKVIQSQAFQGCTNLTTIDFEETCQVESIGSSAFQRAGISGTFTVPNSVKYIYGNAFESCNGIKTLIFAEDSQIEHIYAGAFCQAEGTSGLLSDVYINVSPAREIECDKGAFDKYHTCGQTQIGTVTTRLHYPSEFYSYYVGDYKLGINNGNLNTQDFVNTAFENASNGWQQFMSSGIPIGSGSLWRSYSDDVALIVPDYSIIEVYLVYNYSKDSNTAFLVRMKKGDVIPPKTGVIVHSDKVSTVYLEHNPSYNSMIPYNNESNPDNLYHNEYRNYLKPINGTLRIENVEIVDGVKTYRNYFFNNGTTAASRPGPDWKDEYENITDWGFFRAASYNYTVWNKAFLHLPADMTESTSEILGSSFSNGVYSAKSFGFVIDILDDEESGIATTANGISFNTISNEIYTLGGIQTTYGIKGIVIINGKKVLCK